MNLRTQKSYYAKVRGISLDRDSIVLNGLLPHQGAAMLLDGVSDFMPVTAHGTTMTAYHKLAEANHVFNGHFPDKPVCPGHYLLQMSYQASLIFRFCLTGETLSTPSHIKFKELKNRNPILPGDTVYVVCRDPETDDRLFTCSADIKNQHGITVATVDELSYMTDEFDPAAVKVTPAAETSHTFFQVGDTDLCASAIIEKSLLPHRNHAMLIDGVTSFRKGSHDALVTSVSDLRQHDICFSGSKYCQGHYLLEMAYLTTAMFHHLLTGETKSAPAPFKTEDVAFLRPALPGETLKITCCAPEVRSRTFSCSATITDASNRPIANFGRINGISLK